MGSIFQTLLFAIIIPLPTIGYCDQLRKMILRESSEFFNRDTALILFFSNTLRFLYWIYEPWEGYLLGQSLAVFFVQILMAALAFYFDSLKSEKISFSAPKYLPRNIRYYLNIRKIKHGRDFFTALAGFGIAIFFVFLILVLLIGKSTACLLIILIANLADTLVSIPNFILIVIEKNIEKASVVLVIQFVIGDLMKFLMFWMGGTAWPFVFGALVQICVDGIVAASFFSQKEGKRIGKPTIQVEKESHSLV
jgi:hypothetical protein